MFHFLRDFFDLLRQLWRAYGVRGFDPGTVAEAKAYSLFSRKLVGPSSLSSRPVVFPDDELPHAAPIEWWSVHARLKTSEGYPYALQYVVFLLRPHDLHVSRHLRRHACVSAVGFSLINLSRKTIRRNLRISVAPAQPLLPSFPVTVQTANGSFTIMGDGVFEMAHEKLRLAFTAASPPLLMNEIGFLDFPMGPSFGLSYPRVELTGTMRLYDRTLRVKGDARLDRGWSNDVLALRPWRWFAVTFTNGIDLALAEWGRREQKQCVTVRLSGGAAYTTHAAQVQPGARVFRSRRSGTRYPLDWTIEVPDLDLSLSCVAPFEDGEMTAGFLHYWDGPIEVSGSMQGQAVSGFGSLTQSSVAELRTP
jgi:predicted secreted hydrolase